jgi:hypothetical protein
MRSSSRPATSGCPRISSEGFDPSTGSSGKLTRSWFKPNIPPIPGVGNKGGWAFRDRVPEDDELLIRVKEFTRLTEEGRKLWRFPAVYP